MSAIPGDPSMTVDTNHNVAKLLAETSKIQAETVKIQAEVGQINALTRKLLAESKWHPLVVGTGLLAAGATLGAAIFAIINKLAS